MKANYAPFMDRLIKKYEGGYGWNKSDPGGPTKYGITCYDLAEHRGQTMNSMEGWAADVRAMSLAEAETIYAEKYAAAVMFNDLPNGIDCVMMDYAVNSGPARAVRVAYALFKMPQKARMSEWLLEELRNCDAKWFINAMCDERLAFMHRIRGGRSWKKFGRGWQRRVDDLREYTLSLAVSKKPVAADDLSKVTTPKASNVDPMLKDHAVAGTVATSFAAGAGQHLSQPDQVSPVFFIGIVAAVIAAGVVFYFIKKRAAAKADETVVLPPRVEAHGVA